MGKRNRQRRAKEATRVEGWRPRIAVGAPVAGRDWILPLWFEAIKAQTVQPTSFHFVYSSSPDHTKDTLKECCPAEAELVLYQTAQRYFTRIQRNADLSDPWRAKHMADLRNRLCSLFLASKADVFISLDTDILLKDPETFQKLLQSLEQGWDLASPLVYLHPHEETSECYNAGFFGDSNHGDFNQAWRRAEKTEFEQEPPIQIEVPMAAFAVKRRVIERCAYKAHAQGEDIGFAQDLHKHGFSAAWRQDIVTRHVWGPEFLLKGGPDGGKGSKPIGAEVGAI